MSFNPCRHCNNAAVYKNRHYPNIGRECNTCEPRRKYQEKLEKDRLYKPGEYITALDELLRYDIVMLFESPRHKSVIQSMTLRTIMNLLNGKAFRKAIRKEVNANG